jgi:CRISPR-associated protein Cas1
VQRSRALANCLPAPRHRHRDDPRVHPRHSIPDAPPPGRRALKQHLNTLFVTTQDSYVAKDGDALAVRYGDQVKLRAPITALDGVVCFGRVGISPPAMAMCAEAGVALTFCTEHGRFLARVSGFTPGNVLLRRAQYRAADDPAATAHLARSFLLGKIANARTAILRAARDRPDAPGVHRLHAAAHTLAQSLDALEHAPDADTLRGIEGDAAATYFDAFDAMITNPDTCFAFRSRSRRPPLDPVNALLSFLYAMLAHDVRAACESAGLDAAVGFLHRDRPGRPGLALDLMEELRAPVADRVALTLVNRAQLGPSDFETTPSGAVQLRDTARKTLLAAYQERKSEQLTHPFLGEKMTLGLVPFVQARLLARSLRNELDAYPPFIWK